MEQWEIEARESIRDLVARYNAKGDSGRFDEMLALFADDAVMETDTHTCSGSNEIRAFFEGVGGSSSELDKALGAPIEDVAERFYEWLDAL